MSWVGQVALQFSNNQRVTDFILLCKRSLEDAAVSYCYFCRRPGKAGLPQVTIRPAVCLKCLSLTGVAFSACWLINSGSWSTPLKVTEVGTNCVRCRIHTCSEPQDNRSLPPELFIYLFCYARMFLPSSNLWCLSKRGGLCYP